VARATTIGPRAACGLHVHDAVRVRRARASMLAADALAGLSLTFKTLGDPSRIRILHALASEELCVCDLAAALDMGVSAVSHQLRLLRATRLVRIRREGRRTFYTLDDDHVRSLYAQGLEHIGHRVRRGRT
jgi:ArsR family transcriptional regulator, lead/cadmium/zinc/bismuth-responsive transcriptional repressor